jgi:hypothetical protein
MHAFIHELISVAESRVDGPIWTHLLRLVAESEEGLSHFEIFLSHYFTIWSD